MVKKAISLVDKEEMVLTLSGQINLNTELAIHAHDQVHCWSAYFHPGIGHYEKFSPLHFQPLLFSKP
jgi:hypothetical protein